PGRGHPAAPWPGDRHLAAGARRRAGPPALAAPARGRAGQPECGGDPVPPLRRVRHAGSGPADAGHHRPPQGHPGRGAPRPPVPLLTPSGSRPQAGASSTAWRRRPAVPPAPVQAGRMPLHADPAGGPPVTLRSPDDLLAATPYLLGFHPDLSLVAVAIRDRAVVVVARADLPAPAEPPEPPAEAVLAAVVRQRPTVVALIGYGPEQRVGPAMAVALAGAARRRIRVREALRVEAGRWWSYLCDQPGCCPAAGTRFDPSTSVVAARMTVAGYTALPDRRALARRLAPVSGAARVAMAAATGRARHALEVRLAGLPEREVPAALLADGRAAVARAVDRYRQPAGRLDDDGRSAGDGWQGISRRRW